MDISHKDLINLGIKLEPEKKKHKIAFKEGIYLREIYEVENWKTFNINEFENTGDIDDDNGLFC